MTYEKPPNPYRNITSCHHGFKVQKWRQGELVYAGLFKSLREAIKERDYMESIDWNYDNLT